LVLAAPEGDGRTSKGPAPLTVVIPAFNESARLSDGLARLRSATDATGIDLDAVELLVIDDGSTDGTAQRAQLELRALPHARTIVLPYHLGKGAAVRAGMLAATGRKIVFADADMSIDPVHLPELLAALDRADVAVGSRAHEGHVDYGSRLRTDAGRVFNRAVRTFGGVRLADTQCGFKGFNRGPAILLAHLQTTSGYAFDVELLWLSSKLGLRVAEVAVTWCDVPGSSVRPFAHGARMLVDVAVARKRKRYLAAAELDGVVPTRLPTGTVLVELAEGAMLCASVSKLGALRRALGARGRVRCLSLDELAARSPRVVVAVSSTERPNEAG
jgi:dolichyl-phosphate beta-glucosyltransferase